ncbi:MAG: DNA repair protein RadC [Bacteroidota bacterium]
MQKTPSSWNLQESTTYRYQHLGVDALSDRELIGIIIQNQEKANKLCEHFSSLQSLDQASLSVLIKHHKLTLRQAKALHTAFHLSKRLTWYENAPTRFASSGDTAAFLQAKYSSATREIFSVIYLNRNLAMIAQEAIFYGGVSAVHVDPKIIFKKAVEHLASAIILAHNHPSGNAHPSKEDIQITEMLKNAGELLNIRVLDHIIITHSSYYSFADERLL